MLSRGVVAARDADGQALRIIGTHRDITADKAAAEAVRVSVAHLRAVLESTADGILAVDATGQVLYANRRFAEIWRIPEDLLAVGDDRALLAFVADQLVDPDTFLQQVAWTYTTGTPQMESVIFADGRIVERYSVPMDGHDAASGRVWSFRDVSAREHSAAAVREMEARYRGLVESAFDGSVIQQDGRIVEASRAYEAIFGYPDGALLGMPVLDLVAPESREAARQRIEAGSEFPYELVGQRKNGSHVIVEVAGKACVYQGRPARIAALRDISPRKAGEQALAESEARYRTLAESSCAPLLVHRSGQLLYANPAMRAMVGLPGDRQVVGTDIWQYLHPAYRDLAAERTRHTAAGGTAPRATIQVLAIDGTVLDVESQITRITYDGLPAIAVSLRDITAQKRAETALEESRERFRALSEGSFVAVLMFDQGRVIELNQQAEIMFGYTAEEAVGMLAADCVSPKDRDRVVAAMWSGDEAPYEIAGVRKDGSEFPALVRGRMTHFHGKTVRATSILDLSTLRQAESEARLQGAALEAAANTIVITNRAGRTVWANAAFTTLTGYRRGEAIGRTPGELLRSGVHDAAFYREMWHTIVAGRVWTGELTNRRKDGTRYVEEMTITPVPDAAGVIQHFIAVKQDVTQRKVLEDQFRQAQKMESVGRLAGGVAHDFNNALGAIVVAMEFALREVPTTHPAHADLRLVQATALRAGGIAQQLLQFARQQPIIPALLDLQAILPPIVRMLQRLLGEDIHLVWQPADTGWPIWMDPSQIDQVLTNLCINARDAIRDVGTITLTTENQVVDEAFCTTHPDALPGEYVRLGVRDSGSGMTAETLTQIFEPFFTTKALGEGTGLGLASVYGAVRQNGGFLVVESTLGVGSSFAIYLPRRTKDPTTPSRVEGGAPASAPAASAPSPTGNGRPTVLLVDDDEVLLQLAERVLQENGYTALTASHPAVAARLAEDYPGPIDLLVTDVVMPTMNGKDLARAIRAHRPTIRVLYVSGHSASAISKRGILDPGVHFIQKPFTIEQLATMMRVVLATAAS